MALIIVAAGRDLFSARLTLRKAEHPWTEPRVNGGFRRVGTAHQKDGPRSPRL